MTSEPGSQPPLFSSWVDIDPPQWPQRLFVIAGFAVLGFAAGGSAALLHVVEHRVYSMWQAALVAGVAALPLSGSFVHASRRREHLRLARLSLLFLAIAYVGFAVALALIVTIADFILSQDNYSWQMGVLVGLAVVIMTWKAYAPAALVAGALIGLAVRRLWPLTADEHNALGKAH